MAQLPPPSAAPAGWYADPYRGGALRYFDGRRWMADGPPVPQLAPPAAPHPSLPVSAAAGAVGILIASLVAGRLLIAWLAEYEWPVVVYIAMLTVIGYGPSLWWCRYVSRRWGTGSLGADIGLRFRWSDIGWGPLVWFGALVTQIACAAIVLALDIPLTSNTEGIDDLDADRGYIIAVLVSAVIAAPLVEEMIFRGVVMRGLLSRIGPILTVGVQGVLFGAAHVGPERGVGNVGLALVLSGVGIAFGTAAFLLRRIGPTILAHAVFNGVVLVIVLFFADELSRT
jgi:CAAX protease family protein